MYDNVSYFLLPSGYLYSTSVIQKMTIILRGSHWRCAVVGNASLPYAAQSCDNPCVG